MKTLKNNIIIYDDECPMCRLYTYGFTRTGMLDSGGRMPYTIIDTNLSCSIDKDRARNEIALVDTEHNTVTYGIDSLMKILSNRFGFFTPLFRFKPFYSSMQALYKFISYNRRVIIPSREYNKAGACIPDFNLKYRLLYIGLLNLVSVVLLTLTTNFFYKGIFSLNDIVYTYIFIFTLIGLQSLTAGLERLWEYMGNFTTVVFLQCLTAAMLIPLSGIILQFGGGVFLTLLSCIVLLGMVENTRRIMLLKITCGAAFMYPVNIYCAMWLIIFLRIILL
jgi:hypothetical protein